MWGAARALPAVLILVVAVEWGCAASMKKDLSRVTASKAADMLVSLKQTLRKNNDDYKELRPAPEELHNPYLGGSARLDSDLEGGGNALDNARRSNDDKADKLDKNDKAMEEKNDTVARSSVRPAMEESIPSRRGNRKFDKLHQLLDKEGLLQKFLRGLPNAGKKKAARTGNSGNGGKDGKDAKGGKGEGGMRNRAFQSDEYFPPPPETLPSGELDMLAATGERIDTLKRRGRLCHRHILFPEGPKYDSRGKAYMPGHTLAIDFEHTKRPKLLLPLCCNCCAKSVLGCE